MATVENTDVRAFTWRKGGYHTSDNLPWYPGTGAPHLYGYGANSGAEVTFTLPSGEYISVQFKAADIKRINKALKARIKSDGDRMLPW